MHAFNRPGNRFVKCYLTVEHTVSIVENSCMELMYYISGN